MFLTFIPSNGPICLSKCVCCVLFPARFVPMPSLQWALLSPGVRAEASRYLYRPNSWGPPSQSSEGWAERLSWKLQVKPSVGNVSLFPLFFLLSSSSPSLVFLPWVSRAVRVRSCSARVSWTARQTRLIWISCYIIFSFLSAPQPMFLPHFSSLKQTVFPRFQLKSWLFRTEQERLIFPPTAPQHILSFCCAGQSRPAVAKLSFLCFFPFLPLCGSCGACPILWISTLWSSLLTALPVTYFILSSLHSYHILSPPSWRPLSAFPLVKRSGGKRQSGLSIPPSVQGPSHSQTSHHRHAELTRGEEILT